MTTIKANKDLIHQDGTVSFIKGNTYQIRENVEIKSAKALLMNCTTTNEQGQVHRIGPWYKYFSIIK